MNSAEAKATLLVNNPSLFRSLASAGVFNEMPTQKELELNYERSMAILQGTLAPLFESKAGITLKQPNFHLLAAAVATGVIDMPKAFAMGLQIRQAQLNMAATVQNMLAHEATIKAENTRLKYFAEQQKRAQQSHDASIYNSISKAMASRAEMLNKAIDEELMSFGVPANLIATITKAYGVAGRDILQQRTALSRMGEEGKKAQEVIGKLQEELVSSISKAYGFDKGEKGKGESPKDAIAKVRARFANDPKRLARLDQLLIAKAHNYKAAVIGTHEAYKDYLAGKDPFEHLADYFEIGFHKVADDSGIKTAKDHVERGFRDPVKHLWPDNKQFYKDHYKAIGVPEDRAETLADFANMKDKMNTPIYSGDLHRDLSTALYGVENVKKFDEALIAMANAVRKQRAKTVFESSGEELPDWAKQVLAKQDKGNVFDTGVPASPQYGGGLLEDVPVWDDPKIQEMLSVEPKTTASLFSWYTPPSEYPQPERFQTDFSALSSAKSAIVGTVHAMATLVRYWKDIIKHNATLESRMVKEELGGVYSDLVRGEPIVEEQSPIRGEVKKILSKKPSKLSSEDRYIYGEVIDTRTPLEALKELTGWK